MPHKEEKRRGFIEDVEDNFELESVQPYYDIDKHTYVVDYTQHSHFITDSKNVQVKWKGKRDVALELVKVGNNEFEMSIKWPFSIMNAFALAVIIFDPVYF
jgi:hypothetical protein